MSNGSQVDRDGRLIKFFDGVTFGRLELKSSNDYKNFLGACTLQCKKRSPSYCVELLISRAAALDALRNAIRSCLDYAFISSSVLPFIEQLSHRDVESLNDGNFLAAIVDTIVYPETFWNALLRAHRDSKMPGHDLELFGWLCLQVARARHGEEHLTKHFQDLDTVINLKILLNSQNQNAHSYHYRVEKILHSRNKTNVVSKDTQTAAPGGRHGNDFVDYRKISLLPTNDELVAKDLPFLQRLEDVFQSGDATSEMYLDWLFRLLREDMLFELREDIQTAHGMSYKKKKILRLRGLAYAGYDLGSEKRSVPCGIDISCHSGLEAITNLPKNKAETFLEKNSNYLKHQAVAALCNANTIVAFGTLYRDVPKLLGRPPTLTVRFDDGETINKAIEHLTLKTSDNLNLIVVNTPTFAYLPILERLQKIREVPLEANLLKPRETIGEVTLPAGLRTMVSQWEECSQLGQSVTIKFRKSKPIQVQGAQLKSLVNAFRAPVAQIQGPPGTGKSFIGALIARIILECTDYCIQVLSYTNHAVDQFIEDLMDIGVPDDWIVRLGSKSSEKTKATQIDSCTRRGQYKLNREEWGMIAHLRAEVASVGSELARQSDTIQRKKPNVAQILDHLEFSEDRDLWDAFQVPEDDGFVIVSASQKALTPESVYLSWLHGQNNQMHRALMPRMTPEARAAWRLSLKQRHNLHAKWEEAVQKEAVVEFSKLVSEHNELHRRINSIFDESKRQVLREKRVVACTTTGAAMHSSILNSAKSDVVIIEEAGEILEAHVVTAMGSTTKQLILIGDHKQLPPKVNNYALSKEKGDGYDLNVSMFERLIRHGNSYESLSQQHRSHPDISKFARLLAYKDLEDVDSTLEREPIRGLQHRVVFVNHEHSEEDMTGVFESREAAKMTKKNMFEARMVLKMVKYLGQQGYRTDQMVVLTPYLGQLHLLRDILRSENDPYLNDLDSSELVRAGLMTHAAAKLHKKPLRLSTIDNYQGEESDIVIVSLTRSNPNGDIGFLTAPERLVVLMSRARNGIILFGNMNTFRKSKKGKGLWGTYFEAMEESHWLCDGVPIFCEQHPDRTILLRTPEDFETHCPDGGCAQQCDTKLKCGHACKRRCHRLKDHSKVQCDEVVPRTCARGHNEKLACGQEAFGCKKCAKEDEDTKRRIQRDLELEKKRKEAEDKYRKQLQEIEDEIDLLKRQNLYKLEEENQQKEIYAKREHLENMRQAKTQAEQTKSLGAHKANPPPLNIASDAKDEWQYIRKQENASNKALDKLMDMIGLESVKQEFLSVKTSVDTKIKQGVSLSGERFSCSMLGNPGTGKTTVARLWGEFLVTIGAIAGAVFKEITGSKLAHDGVKGCEALLEDMKNQGGGVLFIDEAYQLSSGNSPGGKAVLDFLLAEVENLRGKVAFVLAGYSKQMESFFAHNPGFPSRFPIEMKFEDYDDKQLLDILKLQVYTKFKGRMSIEDGLDGLYARIATRRVGYSRGKEGFGNARAVENCLAKILKRQATRLRQERRANVKSDDLFLTKEDMIGPEPSAVLEKSKGWQGLQSLWGLDEVKQNAKVLFDTLKTNYDRELAEQPLVEMSLNRVFVGNPGTGKTTVAKHYGQILVDLGLLSNGEVVVKNPSDFVGAHLGQSEAQTKGILAATVGKVLVIDEAYGLYTGGGSSGGGPESNSFYTAVIDTIVAEVQSVPGDDRCVLLLGYQDKMETMFQNVNPGLSRRFPMASAFVFEDFDDTALSKILDFKLKKSGFKASERAKRVAREVLQRARNRPHFGNAGEIDILLDRAKVSLQKRNTSGKSIQKDVFEPVDFDQDYARAESSNTNIKMLFEGDVGREDLIQKLEEYQTRVQECRRVDMDPEIPFNFLFRGPPGTGKTSTARKIGKVYYDMGFLSAAQVHECSATELIGEYVGHTGPKVQRLAEQALGRVLFIDEAYRLGEGTFAKEALDELVDLTTKPKFQNKLVIVLAGYVNDINQLVSRNPGMASRFPEVIDFAPLPPRACVALMTSLLQKRKKMLESKGKIFDVSCLVEASPAFLAILESRMRDLSKLDGWASARDVETITKEVFRGLSLKPDVICLSEAAVVSVLDRMFDERKARMQVQHPPKRLQVQEVGVQDLSHPTSSGSTSTSNQASTQDSEDTETDESPVNTSSRLGIRDAGVSGEVWEQLQRDAAEEDRKEKEFQELKRKQKAASSADRDKILRQILEEEERRKKEEATKQKLMQLGRCPVGYHWIKQSGGYRCAGGSHWMSDSDIENL